MTRSTSIAREAVMVAASLPRWRESIFIGRSRSAMVSAQSCATAAEPVVAASKPRERGRRRAQLRIEGLEASPEYRADAVAYVAGRRSGSASGAHRGPG